MFRKSGKLGLFLWTSLSCYAVQVSEVDFTLGARIPPFCSHKSFTWQVALALALAASCLAPGMAGQRGKTFQDALFLLEKEEALGSSL